MGLNTFLPGNWSSKSVEFDGDSRRILTLRYGWTDHGGLANTVAVYVLFSILPSNQLLGLKEIKAWRY